MVEFKFIEYGTDFGSSVMGQKLRQKLLALINEGEKVVLDFTGRTKCAGGSTTKIQVHAGGMIKTINNNDI